jgi:hypothetical protein
MADFTEKLSEVLYPLAYEHADSMAVGTHTSSYVSLANYHRAWLVLNVGDMGQASTLDVTIRQATNTSGGSVKAISGKGITQLTQAGGDGDDLVCIELRTEELDVTNGFDCVCVRAVVAGAAVEYGYILYGCVPRFAPTATTNWAERVA